MQAALRVTTKVLPGNRIEITAPKLREGESVDVLLVLPETPSSPRRSVLDIIAPLPPGPHSYSTWEAFERRFQEERNSWDR